MNTLNERNYSIIFSKDFWFWIKGTIASNGNRIFLEEFVRIYCNNLLSINADFYANTTEEFRLILHRRIRNRRISRLKSRHVNYIILYLEWKLFKIDHTSKIVQRYILK